ncbi:MAG: glycoside hydrolase family 32 protein [Chloroflexi bacterium]|nr:glycoside hydrolase family 32 protein [Chloroflexota bacterium]
MMTPPNPQDFHRPTYHFLPAANWMNDPNGVIQWNGRYHLFFQYNPDGAYHANMHWGHAVSDDLVHWEELPIAIAPTPNSPDQAGIWSGCMVNDDGIPTAIYTGVNDDYSRQVQCLAFGNDDLTRWTKHSGNPALSEIPTHCYQARDFRDPFVWREDDRWYMTVSGHIKGVGGAALLYRSEDLRDWQYLHPLFVGDRARHGYNFECVNFFPLGEKWVMIISSMFDGGGATVLALVGRYENHRFTPESETVYDAGYGYAPLTHVDDQGRRLIWAWLREGRSVDKQVAAGWSGVQAIPRVLGLDSRQRLVSHPVPEIKALRGAHHRFSASDLHEGALPISGLALDIEAEFDAQMAATCGIELARSPDGGEKVAITYDASTEALRVTRQFGGEEAELEGEAQGLAHRLDPGENLQLRILLDGSVIDVIANGRARVTSRFYASDATSQGLRVINPAAVLSLDVWEMASIG